MPRPRYLFTRDLLFSAIVLAVMCTMPANTADAQVVKELRVSPKPLGTIFQDAVRPVLEACGSWPPRIAADPKDQKEKEQSTKLQVKTDDLTSRFFAETKLTPTQMPRVYEASFLRLLDSAGNFNPLTSDDDLLGMAWSADLDRLGLWGTDVATLRLDCSSVLGMLASANVKYSIPFFSLDGAFRASQDKNRDQSITFLYGSFQSPYQLLSRSEDPTKRRFAMFRALALRINRNDDSAMKYVASAKMLSVSHVLRASEVESLAGNLKAGISIPLVQLGGEAEASLKRGLRLTSSIFRTYLVEVNERLLPNTASLAMEIQRLLPAFRASTSGVIALTELSASSDVVGWPQSMCSDGQWFLTVDNRSYKAGPVHLVQISDVTGLPACRVTASFTPQTTATPDNLRDPRLKLTYNGNGDVSFELQLADSLTLVDQPQVFVTGLPRSWTAEPTDQEHKSALTWRMPGTVKLATGRRLVSKSINRLTFKCVEAGQGGEHQFSEVRFGGDGDPSVRTGERSDFELVTQLSLNQLPPYDPSPSQPGIKPCVVEGSMMVESDDGKGGARASQMIPFKSGTQTLFPPELPSSPPAIPVGVQGRASNGNVVLDWRPSAGATRYDVYRSENGGDPAKIGDNLSGVRFDDKSVTNGKTYAYQVRATNAVGSSALSQAVDATPVAPPPAVGVVQARIADNQVILTWPKVDSASGYSIYRGNASGQLTQIQGGITTNTFSEPAPPAGQTVYYQVSATNAGGEGGRSSEASLTR